MQVIDKLWVAIALSVLVVLASAWLLWRAILFHRKVKAQMERDRAVFKKRMDELRKKVLDDLAKDGKTCADYHHLISGDECLFCETKLVKVKL